MLLGCIADDFTGATDLANMLVRGGMRTVQTIGIAETDTVIDADAVVVSLKSRTTDAAQAVAESLQACRWLKKAGAKQIFFKYCSTFDSTASGNIGPVTDALMQELDCTFTIACPAFPENGRSVYRGYLFVGDMLLNESGMEKHPLTPMTDANLVRVLQSQTAQRVGLARFDVVAAGTSALRKRFEALKQDGIHMAIVDAVSDADLYTIGEACAQWPLLTGGSGIALGLPRNFERLGLLKDAGRAATMPLIEGPGLVIAGSCSKATNAQVAQWCTHRPAFRIDPFALQRREPVIAQAIEWAKAHLSDGPVLIYASSSPEEVAEVQKAIGVESAGALIETALATLASTLVNDGVRRLICAGGETSGAVVKALGIARLQVGPQIDPGVPWMVTKTGEDPLALALKSGNFGSVDFFEKAFAMLDAT